MRPNDIGIAFGTFADPLMPWPTLSVWEMTRHPWVAFDHPVDRFTGGLHRRGDLGINLLVETIETDLYPLSPRIRVLRDRFLWLIGNP